MELPRTETLDLELAQGWLTIWFNDPERRNPLTAARVAEITALCAHLQGRRDIRGVVFRGRGGIFCAGGDLKAFQDVFQSGADRDAVQIASREAGVMFDAVARLPQFTVMAVEGAAMAGGLGLACAGDQVVAADGARFALSEVRIGLTPAQIAPHLVARLGMTCARRLMLTGAMMDASRAWALGLVDDLVEGPEGIADALDRARIDLAGAAPGAVAAIKAQLAGLPTQTAEQRIAAAAESFADRMLSDEARDGIASFFEKRKPAWAGGEGA